MRWCILCDILIRDFGRFGGLEGFCTSICFVSWLRLPADGGSVRYGVQCLMVAESEDETGWWILFYLVYNCKEGYSTGLRDVDGKQKQKQKEKESI